MACLGETREPTYRSKPALRRAPLNWASESVASNKPDETTTPPEDWAALAIQATQARRAALFVAGELWYFPTDAAAIQF